MKAVQIRDKKRRKLYEKVLYSRFVLKFLIKKNYIYTNPILYKHIQTSFEELSKDSNKIRLVNRCLITGQSRSVLRKFKLSRIKVRELALAGMLNGISKSSW